MAVAYKGVGADFKSSGMTDPTLRAAGLGAFTPAEWALLELDYGLGLTVTPDPAVELEVKAGNPWHARDAAESAGVYAFAFRPGQHVAPESAARSGVPQTAASGYVIVLEYDPDDLIDERVSRGFGCSEIQVASATVVGIHTPTYVWVNTSNVLDLQVAIGDADGSVTYSAEDSDENVVASGTATNAAGVGHFTATFTTPASPTTLTITWSGTWGGVARTFTTRAIVR